MMRVYFGMAAAVALLAMATPLMAQQNPGPQGNQTTVTDRDVGRVVFGPDGCWTSDGPVAAAIGVMKGAPYVWASVSPAHMDGTETFTLTPQGTRWLHPMMQFKYTAGQTHPRYLGFKSKGAGVYRMPDEMWFSMSFFEEKNVPYRGVIRICLKETEE